MAPVRWLNKSMAGPMEETIARKLAQELQPVVLEIENDSGRHAGHAGDNGSGESHFNVYIVSASFDGKSRVDRQRIVYDILAEELAGSLHALALKTVSMSEYDRLR